MGQVNVDNLRTGMILESDLYTPDGRFLLPQGTVLEAGHIKTCKAWGVNQADIEGHDQAKLNAARMAEIDPEILEKSKLFLKPYVSWCNFRHPAMAEIIRIAVEQVAMAMGKGKFNPPQNQISDFDLDGLSIKRASNLREGESSALRLVREQTQLISLPDIFYKITEAMESPFSSAKHIADVVSKDSSLSAKLLRLVNSAFYGFPSKIDSISRAVAILGTRELTTLAMGISVARVFDGIPENVLNMEGFWRHSVGCAVFSGLIATQRQGISEERFFVAGLLHDIGRLIMIKAMPEDCLNVIYMSMNKKIPLYLAEQELLGFDHAKIGGFLCKEWKMPVVLEKMVRFHHEPEKARNVVDAGTVHLANILTIAMEPDSAGEGIFPRLCDNAWEKLGLDRNNLSPIVQQAEKSIEEIIQIFLGGDN